MIKGTWCINDVYDDKTDFKAQWMMNPFMSGNLIPFDLA